VLSQARMAFDTTSGRASGPPTDESAVGREYAAATQGAAFRLMPERTLVRVTGDDRVNFMHGMCSQDIKALKPGMVSYGLVLTERAHVVADFYVYGHERELLLELDRSLWPQASELWEKLIVADDVELREDESLSALEIQGGAAPSVLERALSPVVAIPEPFRFITVDGLTLACLYRRGCRSFTLLGEQDAVRKAMTRLGSAATDPQALEVSADVLDIVRVENGVARVGVDTDAKTIALEARLEAGISFGKGCYLGQETIERVSARGQLKKRLFGLRVRGERTVEPGAVVLLAGKEVGRVSSSVLSPRLGSLALATLHHSAWTLDTEVAVEDSGGQVAATVSDLPFA